MEIDLNRGVTIRIDPASGARVYMYKDEPGKFLNVHGHEVADSLAAACGFPTKDLKKLREKREALAQASAEIEKAFETEQTSKVAGKLVVEEDGYKVMQHAFGRCWVLGPDGEKMHDKPRTKEEALHLLKVLKSKSTDAEEEGADANENANPESEGDKDGT